MNLYKNILYHITFITIYLSTTTSITNKGLKVTESGIDEVTPCSVGMQFFSTLNNTSEVDFHIEMSPEECCLISEGLMDCDSFGIIGECSEVLPKDTTRTLTLVAPILDPFERKGYCLINVDSRPIDRKNNIMRDTIKINFDTGIKHGNEYMNSVGLKPCKNIDEDPLNDCKPVDCDTYYNGKKSHYDKNNKRCIKVPNCNDKESNVERVYDSVSNRCVDEEAISKEDIKFIKSLNNERQPKDVIIVESGDFPSEFQLNSTAKDFNNNLDSLNNLQMVDTNKTRLVETKTKFMCGSIVKYLTLNKYTLLVLGIVIFVQCCLIFTLIYYLTKRSIRSDRKEVKRKFFNYRQDVSVTTPLIATSNIDTETTGFDYISESSNIDKKIKCYKACQRKSNAKISMSDDILSKCVNRRDWSAKPKSDTNNERGNLYSNIQNEDWNVKHADTLTQSNNYQSKDSNSKQINDRNVENKEEFKKETVPEELINKLESRKIKEDYNSNSDSSEKEIQCHDYNYKESRQKFPRKESSFKPSEYNFRKNESKFRTTESNGSPNACHFGPNAPNIEPNYHKSESSKKAVSMSTEKSAQACFSNDSIDDFLSERGMIFLAGENLSKYSFASNSTPNSSKLSSKTSKNIIQNVLSYISKKSKKLTSSDPGVKKSNDKLELIHMSRASVYSSTASECGNVKGIKLVKESRSSF